MKVFALYSLMCLIFSTVFIFTKIGLNIGWTPFLFSGIRFVSAGLIIIITIILKRKSISNSIWKNQLRVFKIGIYMTGIPFATVYWSIQYLDSGIISILVTLGAFFTFILEKIKKKNKFKLIEVIGISLCVSGTFIIAIPDFYNNVHFNFIIVIMFVIAEFFFAFGSVEVKKLITKTNINAFILNGFQMFYGGVFLLAINFLSRSESMKKFSLNSFFLLLYFILIASILANSIYYWLIEKKGAFFPATQTYVSPILAILLGSIFLNEKITYAKVVASICIITGLIMMYSNNFKIIFKRRR